MWIFDSYHRGAVELWDRSRGSPKPFTFRYLPSFYLHLEDPHVHWEMIEGLESRFKVDGCSFDTVYGPLSGYEIWAGRDIADKIENPTSIYHIVELVVRCELEDTFEEKPQILRIEMI